MNTYLEDLVKYRKKKTRLFQWKVVGAYGAERVEASELEENWALALLHLTEGIFEQI